MASDYVSLYISYVMILRNFSLGGLEPFELATQLKTANSFYPPPLSKANMLRARFVELASRRGGLKGLSNLAVGRRLQSTINSTKSDKTITPNTASLAEAVSSATTLVQPKMPVEDPFSIVSNEMSTLATNIGKLIGSSHPTLNKVAMYYFRNEGKHVRPLAVLVLSKALSAIPMAEKDRGSRDEEDVKANVHATDSKSPLAILHEVNPNVVLNPLSRPMDVFPSETDGILPKQRRLAEIVEMIHTASLLHDDIIDNSVSKISTLGGNVAFNNKMAILAGDFLLGRASVAIARLRNAEVIELLSTTIANLVEGEFMQLKNASVSDNVEAQRERFKYYINRSYLKTASLMSKSCRASAVLAGARDDVVEACYQFGRNLGLCFQVVDDMLAFTADGQEIDAGMFKTHSITAPLLLAWEKYPELGELIKREFSEAGDIQLAEKMIHDADSLNRTRELAQEYAAKAVEQLMILPDSEARASLINLTHTLINRKQ